MSVAAVPWLPRAGAIAMLGAVATTLPIPTLPRRSGAAGSWRAAAAVGSVRDSGLVCRCCWAAPRAGFASALPCCPGGAMAAVDTGLQAGPVTLRERRGSDRRSPSPCTALNIACQGWGSSSCALHCCMFGRGPPARCLHLLLLILRRQSSDTPALGCAKRGARTSRGVCCGGAPFRFSGGQLLSRVLPDGGRYHALVTP